MARYSSSKLWITKSIPLSLPPNWFLYGNSFQSHISFILSEYSFVVKNQFLINNSKKVEIEQSAKIEFINSLLDSKSFHYIKSSFNVLLGGFLMKIIENNINYSNIIYIIELFLLLVFLINNTASLLLIEYRNIDFQKNKKLIKESLNSLKGDILLDSLKEKSS